MDAVWLYCNTLLTTHTPGVAWVDRGWGASNQVGLHSHLKTKTTKADRQIEMILTRAAASQARRQVSEFLDLILISKGAINLVADSVATGSRI